MIESDWEARGNAAEAERLRDWLESQQTVFNFWMTRLTDTADHDLIHRIEAHRESLNQLVADMKMS